VFAKDEGKKQRENVIWKDKKREAEGYSVINGVSREREI
jgi:hypothetical protein